VKASITWPENEHGQKGGQLHQHSAIRNILKSPKMRNRPCFIGDLMARPERLELPTLWFEARRSIQLSYGRILGNSIIFTLLRGYVKIRNRRNFGAFGATSRYIEPNAHYFRLVEPLFKLLVHARIEFGHRLRLMPHPKIVDVLLAALPA
jgi:hypothetical protein